MTIGSIFSQIGLGPKQASERYAEYHSAPSVDQYMPYAYETPTSHGHIAYSKHNHGGGGHKNGAAMSALTLLAFLFFLNILQQCLKDHMNAMSTPQVMLMTAGREGEDNISEKNKLDKTGMAKSNDKINKNVGKVDIIKNSVNEDNHGRPKNEIRNPSTKTKGSNDKMLTKIHTADHIPKKGLHNYKNRSLAYAGFVNAMYEDDKTLH